MTGFINYLYKNQPIFFKGFLFIVTTFLIVYLFPKGGTFRYDIPKGKPWQYENLYAPFDFAILKTPEEIAAEKEAIKISHIPYYEYDSTVVENVVSGIEDQFAIVFPDTLPRREINQLKRLSEEIAAEIYQFGLLQEIVPRTPEQLVYLKKGNEANEITYQKILKQSQLRNF